MGERNRIRPAAAEGPHLGREIGLDSSSLRCCETREEEENPNPAVKPEKKKKILIQQLLTAEGKGDQQGLIRAKRWT